ncbi:flagellar motor protein MotB [Flavimaricola marinus]|uniref:Motility protein B n=1 Tax=Flavimaricola marinus TaxID=1819565 RepID=A0A238LF01_9RHOB|nr:flagellar motor protein MotB [Flavimaricola marinus]SMY08211.1 Motility protein B [Flavimaricola marinus]
MSAQANAPIIIKRKKVIAGGGHHGGAWKVAYADFVTAMMAFFMLMWLLNATTEQQRKGIADYFTPTIAVNRVSGGGEDMFGGEDFQSTNSGLRRGNGGIDVPEMSEAEAAAAQARAAEVDLLRDIEEILLGSGGEAVLSENALRHVVTRLTDEGLVIEIFALPGIPIFDGMTDQPLPLTVELLNMIARVSAIIPNPVAFASHIPSQPIVLAENPVWDVTTARAMEARRVMQEAGFDPDRTARLTGHGDQSPFTEQPLDVRNDRLEIILLREVP